MKLIEHLRTWDEIPDDDAKAFHWLDLKTAEAADLIERQAAQIEMMREFIARAPVSSGVCCCGEAIDGHGNPMSCGHTPVDLWDHSVERILATTPDQALAQFAAKVREQCAHEGWMAASGDCEDRVRAAIRNITELPK